MTSRLTLAALAFSIASTFALVHAADARPAAHAASATRVVQLAPVAVTFKRLPAEA